MLSYLVPAVILAVAAQRRGAGGAARAWTAIGAALGLLWALLALRHGFHGARMDAAPTGRAELSAYAVLALLTARALADPRLAERPVAGWLVKAAPSAAWAALAWAVLVFAWLASPWWGPDQQHVTALAAVLLLTFYAGGAALLWTFGRRPDGLGRTALACAVGVAFALLSLVLRFAFHGGEMGLAVRGGGGETWAFSAAWAVFGLVVLSLGSVRRNVVLRWSGLAVLLVTAAKVLLFDLARLEGVVRAASFLAVGALLLGGAVLVRRLNARDRRQP